jgi:hypothetical protein
MNKQRAVAIHAASKTNVTATMNSTINPAPSTTKDFISICHLNAKKTVNQNDGSCEALIMPVPDSSQQTNPYVDLPSQSSTLPALRSTTLPPFTMPPQTTFM